MQVEQKSLFNFKSEVRFEWWGNWFLESVLQRGMCSCGTKQFYKEIYKFYKIQCWTQSSTLNGTWSEQLIFQCLLLILQHEVHSVLWNILVTLPSLTVINNTPNMMVPSLGGMLSSWWCSVLLFCHIYHLACSPNCFFNLTWSEHLLTQVSCVLYMAWEELQLDCPRFSFRNGSPLHILDNGSQISTLFFFYQ